MTRLIHYSNKPLERIESREQEPLLMKPKGLWVSVENSNGGWKEWCEAEGYNLDHLAVETEVRLLPDANVFWLKDTESILDFSRCYGTPLLGSIPIPDMKCDWIRLAETRKGPEATYLDGGSFL